jgi:hypothetical protein
MSRKNDSLLDNRPTTISVAAFVLAALVGLLLGGVTMRQYLDWEEQ